MLGDLPGQFRWISTNDTAGRKTECARIDLDKLTTGTGHHLGLHLQVVQVLP